MKRVGCLYRVSTKKQTNNNDIPMQKKSCRQFIQQKEDWVLVKEYLELGISGYKVSEKERDILKNIKNDVINKEIDILLVFMLDRIGRREDETPFIVKWLIEQGIEVWSVNEGQRQIKDNYDKLINYITYWQAQNESEKISIRAREKRIQLTKQGIYMGNYAPYGYKLIESNIITKIGKKRKILKILEEEAKIVKIIFHLIANKQYGTDKVAIYLNSKGYKRRKKEILWDNNIINDIVKNPIYKGYVTFGKRQKNREGNIRNKKEMWIISEVANSDIIIISEDLWKKANNVIESRTRKGNRILRLLSGYTRCGYCKDYIVPKGKEKYCYLVCKGKQKTGDCIYNRNYKVEILEEILKKEIKQYLDTYKKVDLQNIIIKRTKKITKKDEKITQIKQKISYSENKLIELKKEVISALMSTNENTSKKINEEFNKENENLKTLKQDLQKLKQQINNNNISINQLKKYIPNWSIEFEKSSLETKRKIIEKLIDKIYLYNDKIEITIKYPISKIIEIEKERTK